MKKLPLFEAFGNSPNSEWTVQVTDKSGKPVPSTHQQALLIGQDIRQSVPGWNEYVSHTGEHGVFFIPFPSKYSEIKSRNDVWKFAGNSYDYQIGGQVVVDDGWVTYVETEYGQAPDSIDQVIRALEAIPGWDKAHSKYVTDTSMGRDVFNIPWMKWNAEIERSVNNGPNYKEWSITSPKGLKFTVTG